MLATGQSNASKPDIRTIANKLHRQFAHPTPDKLIRLIRNSGVRDVHLEKEVEAVSKQCITCIRLQRPPPRPVVCMPLASKFNETVAMDLKVWMKYHF